MLKDANLLHKAILFLQCPEDVRDYGSAFPELKIVESPPGLLETANFISNDYFSTDQNILQLHDDVQRIVYFESKQKKVAVDDIDQLFKKQFQLMRENGLCLGGLY